MVKNSSMTDYRQLVFLTDALSVLEALNNGGEPELTDSIKSLDETHRVALQLTLTFQEMKLLTYWLNKIQREYRLRKIYTIMRRGRLSSPISEIV